MFSLTNATAKLSSVNLRCELHGESPKPACDLKLEVAMGNDVLDTFAPGLKDALYRKAQVDLVSDQKLRFEKLGVLPFDAEIIGARFVLAYGATGRTVELAGVNVNGFKLACEEGGTVLVTVRIQGHHDEKSGGKLSMLVGENVTVSIIPPLANEIADLARQVTDLEGEGGRATTH